MKRGYSTRDVKTAAKQSSAKIATLELDIEKCRAKRKILKDILKRERSNLCDIQDLCDKSYCDYCFEHHTDPCLCKILYLDKSLTIHYVAKSCSRCRAVYKMGDFCHATFDIACDYARNELRRLGGSAFMAVRHIRRLDMKSWEYRTGHVYSYGMLEFERILCALKSDYDDDLTPVEWIFTLDTGVANKFAGFDKPDEDSDDELVSKK